MSEKERVMTDTRRFVVLIDPNNAPRAVVFASQSAAERWRDVAEENGVETFGLLPIVSRVEGLVD